MLYRLMACVLIFITGWGAGWVMHEQQIAVLPESVILEPPPELLAGETERVVLQPISSEWYASNDLSGLLQRQDIDAVMAYYTRLQGRADAAALNAARLQLLTHTRALLESQRFIETQQLLQAFLVLNHRDVEARILLAAAYHGQDDIQVAIDQLYEAKGYAYQPTILRGISDRIRNYVAGLTQSLKQQDDNSALLALYQHLVQQEPDYAPYFVGLAAAQLSLHDSEAARRSLALIVQDPSVGAQAQSMLLKINETLQQAADSGETAAVIGVPLQRNGNHFIVSARPANARSIQLLIDTGASLTVFTPDVFNQRGIRYEDTGKIGVFSTANGSVRAPIYRLAALQVGDWQVNDLEVGVMDLGGSSSMDGLLGMNFLSNFQFFIDQNESVLRLSIN